MMTTIVIHQNRCFFNSASTSPSTTNSLVLDNSFILFSGPYINNVSYALRITWAIFSLTIVPSLLIARMKAPNLLRKLPVIKLFPTISDLSVIKHSTTTLSSCSNSSWVSFSSVSSATFSTSFILRKFSNVPLTNRISPSRNLVSLIMLVIILPSLKISRTMTS